MNEGFPSGIAVNPVIDLKMERLVKFGYFKLTGNGTFEPTDEPID